MIMPKVMLTRVVSSKRRYYQISLGANLFGWYEMERVYGSMSNKSPTGHIREYYTNMDAAVREFDRVVKQKIGKGYVPTKRDKKRGADR